MIHYWQIQEHFYYIACCVLCSAHFLWCHDAKFCQKYSFCSMILLDTAATLVQHILRLCIPHCNSYKVIGLIQIHLKSLGGFLGLLHIVQGRLWFFTMVVLHIMWTKESTLRC